MNALIENQVILVVLSILSYIIAVIGFWFVLDYFFGNKVANNVTKVIGFPLIAVIFVIIKIVEAIKWPWNYRNSRLMREIFNIQLKAGWDLENQVAIDQKMAELATQLEDSFKRQTIAAKSGTDIKMWSTMADHYKKYFWQAHGLAKKNMFQVRKSYKDYLK